MPETTTRNGACVTLTSQVQLGVMSDPTIARFEREVGPLWPFVAPFMARYQGVVNDPAESLSGLVESLRSTVSRPATAQLANDLLALLPGWAYFSNAQRCILQTAAAYLVETDDAMSDDAPGGMDDDDRVVRAAVCALLRRSRR